jgi:signal transduction histidine kinase
MNATPDVLLKRRWHSATSRLLIVYVLVFSCSIMMLLGVMSRFVTGEMERQNDQVMSWQITYMRSIPADRIVNVVRQRIEKENLHTAYYGLFSPSGAWLAGDVRQLPANVRIGAQPVTLEHTLPVIGDQASPVTRVMADRLDNGDILLVARDLTRIRSIRRELLNSLIFGGVLSLVAGAAGGLTLSVRQMQRVRAVRRATLAISQGDLNRRLPTGGRDELDMLAHLVNHMLDEVERLMTEVKGACDGIAHDLRTPLAHIRALLSQVEEVTGPYDDAELSALLARARRETDQLLDRFRAMLRISEIGAFQRRGAFAAFDLAGLLEEIVELYEPLAESREIVLSYEGNAVGPIHGDRALLFEAFSNVVDNAIKFTQSGGTVHVRVHMTGAGPQIDIVDDGPGIPTEERHAVMQRFYRGDSTQHIAGAGLGLNIVSAVLRVHDFTARISSAEPGTRFTVECWAQTLA